MIEFVFNTLTTDEYNERALPALKQQIVFGGARLAAVIKDIYGNDSRLSTISEFNDMVFSFLN